MRGVSRDVLARGAAWSVADGSCKDLTIEWSRWEALYAASPTAAARQAALTEPAAVCDACPIATECADLAELSGYTVLSVALFDDFGVVLGDDVVGVTKPPARGWSGAVVVGVAWCSSL